MNRFVIVNGLPYLYANGKTYSVRWDDAGFTVGTEVELASVPDRTYSELSIKAKCADRLDSIKAVQDEVQDETEDETQDEVQDEKALDEMSLKELKDYAKANDIDLNGARTKAEILAVIKDGQAVS